MRAAHAIAFLALLAAAAAFVALTSHSLPDPVASHFAVGGTADGFMPRAGYVNLMLALAVGVPLFMALASSIVRVVPPRLVSLPHRDHWLAPERRAATIAFLQWHGAFFGAFVALFICFVHWLVVQANARQPPALSETLLLAGAAVFVAVLVAWIGVLFVRFRRPGGAGGGPPDRAG